MIEAKLLKCSRLGTIEAASFGSFLALDGAVRPEVVKDMILHHADPTLAQPSRTGCPER